MTYRELFTEVCARVPTNMAVSIQVETWRHRSGAVETVWSIYLGNGSRTLQGSTAIAALAALRAHLAPASSDVPDDPCVVTP